jgi:hypothetical protein
MKRAPRKLQLSSEVARLLTRISSLEGLGRAPGIEARAVEDLEEELHCEFTDDVLALFAGGDELYSNDGIDLTQVMSVTRWARKHGAALDLVVIGQAVGDGHIYYCVKRRPTDLERGRIYTFCNEDRSTSSELLTAWLEQRVERIEEGLEDQPDAKKTENGPPFEAELVGPENAAPLRLRVKHAKFGDGEVIREIGEGS